MTPIPKKISKEEIQEVLDISQLMTAQQKMEVNALYSSIEDEKYTKADKHLVEVMKEIQK